VSSLEKCLLRPAQFSIGLFFVAVELSELLNSNTENRPVVAKGDGRERDGLGVWG